MNGFYSRVIELLRLHGFELRRQKGSHQSWCRKNLCVTVSTNCDSRFTANAIMKQAGIDHRF